MTDRVTLYGKPGCHLCDDARVIVQQVCAELGVGWTEIDITQDDDLFQQYGEQIPVTCRGRPPARLLAGRPGQAEEGLDNLVALTTVSLARFCSHVHKLLEWGSRQP